MILLACIANTVYTYFLVHIFLMAASDPFSQTSAAVYMSMIMNHQSLSLFRIILGLSSAQFYHLS